MNRNEMLGRIEGIAEPWDMVVIGGGATGVGTAVEAASRGYRTLLLEQSDFAKGTSSRSTKLIHGGVRYLRQGNLALVLEALRERWTLFRNAPHLVRDLPFIVPNYDWWEAPFYGIGLKLYDLLAGKRGLQPSRHLSKEETLDRIPTIETRGLRGGVIYHDGQFDDARFVIHLAETAAGQGAALLNYMKVTALVKTGGLVCGVRVLDLEAGREHEVESRAVINATGPFADAIRRMDDPEAKPMIRPSQGVHIVLDRSFLPGDSAVMVPRTEDGRVLFAIPWHGRVVVGTTDTPVDTVPQEPVPRREEIAYLLSHAARYLTRDPAECDVLSAFAGIRPLVGGDNDASTAALSREHRVGISRSGLVTIAGGKWTTYRKMAEDAVDQAALVAGLEERPSVSRELRLHGYHEHADRFGDLGPYGSDAPAIRNLIEEEPRFEKRLHPKLSLRAGEVVWAVRHEMAVTVEDVLARRSRALQLDARAAMETAPAVAELMAEALSQDAAWKQEQVKGFLDLAKGYLP